jgi:hypothetical protein
MIMLGVGLILINYYLHEGLSFLFSSEMVEVYVISLQTYFVFFMWYHHILIYYNMTWGVLRISIYK